MADIRTCRISPVVPKLGVIGVQAQAMSGGQARLRLALFGFGHECTVNGADLVELRRLIDGTLHDMGETEI